jgi:hypothetical protein
MHTLAGLTQHDPQASWPALLATAVRGPGLAVTAAAMAAVFAGPGRMHVTGIGRAAQR